MKKTTTTTKLNYDKIELNCKDIKLNCKKVKPNCENVKLNCENLELNCEASGPSYVCILRFQILIIHWVCSSDHHYLSVVCQAQAS